MPVQSSRNRRDRGPRGPLLPPGTPRYRTTSQLFDAAVVDAYTPLLDSYPEQLRNLDIAVDTVPRMRLRPDMTVFPEEIAADGPVPLGRVIPAGVDSLGRPTRARIVIFRKPVEQRCSGTGERTELLRRILTQLVAAHLNVDPADIDPRFHD
ncbi:metallopeptidase family protein [Corynebacterium sp. CCM 8835]|uniref:Metallopeptidase family protein n=1 Tax=Corynebacterium antarcticum TaxID=2800405 RepID=A0ABS1FI47_9CORY|nr:metallopeptidase family protein [Corynebacterium antarcticum]MCK7642181.1 metallopeptidase family protein [Corynebacterium antarcticum]MCK7661135.1 metallopeptidase family protein [Corynebacterium antarcticum]MCL0245883.1 metallopeptidase family protein [Corynebacterium antarcticum]MCX7491660.1 metallopeptidase family protein [Corynebacterium antarcticum]MCX7540457.1 metallopeptidase family protein [Corynebacterium antarcticum]